MNFKIRLEKGIEQGTPNTRGFTIGNHFVSVEGGKTNFPTNPWRIRHEEGFVGVDSYADEIIEYLDFTAEEEMLDWAQTLIGKLEAESYKVVRSIADGQRLDWMSGIFEDEEEIS